MNHSSLWDRYRKYLCGCEAVGLTLDVSRMNFPDDFLATMTPKMNAAFDAMDALEGGAIANPDENRMVGHYWLRTPKLSPSAGIRDAIEKAQADVRRFAVAVHEGAIAPQRGDAFDVVLVVGIGGSTLGPQLLSDALGTAEDPLLIRFIDNTDPDGIDRTLADLDDLLERTLTIVVSKSGGTIETRNGMLEVAAAYRRAGLDFHRHAVAVTSDGSKLHDKAVKEKWLATFPMWDFVGGRTSLWSPVGLLPAALQGLDFDALLDGARLCDEATRQRDILKNPAAMLALMWHYAGNGRGDKAMVVLPYKDRLLLFSRYLQQLVMESLGKGKDRAGNSVTQGLTVYGNKGSTDQHAFVQQLQEGRNDFFATFVRVLKDRAGENLFVEDGVTSGDYLHGFWLGTRDALTAAGRESITITLDELSARSLGALLALFERAVGLYAELINVNAYHQPGVEAGKKAAAAAIDVQRRILAHLRAHPGKTLTADELAAALKLPNAVEVIQLVLTHLDANRFLH